MTVAAILRNKGTDIISASPENTLSDVCAILGSRKIGAVMVLDRDGGIAGIISERDAVAAISREGREALDNPVSTYMTRNVVTCSGDDSINDVMGKMTSGRFRHLPVMKDGALVGLISIGDVVKERIAEAEREAEEMRTYIAMA